ncbi:MAG: hypothetical protein AAFQ66_15995 [Pseudomonadota bacterium]
MTYSFTSIRDHFATWLDGVGLAVHTTREQPETTESVPTSDHLRRDVGLPPEPEAAAHPPIRPLVF